VGFTAGHVAGVWVGNDDNRPMRDVTGGRVPARMWKQAMLAAEEGVPATPLDRSERPEIAPEPLEDFVGDVMQSISPPLEPAWRPSRDDMYAPPPREYAPAPANLPVAPPPMTYLDYRDAYGVPR
jgi:penicillin-binding protein 1A